MESKHQLSEASEVEILRVSLSDALRMTRIPFSAATYEDDGNARKLQRSVLVHGEFRTIDHGGGHSQRQGQAILHGL